MKKPTLLEQSIQTILSNDHSRIEGMLEQVLAQTGQDTPEFRDRWRAFELTLLTHLYGEEMHVFRAFRAAHPEQAQSLVAEHDRLRERITELAIALDLHSLGAHQVLQLVEQLRAHMARENALLYPWAAFHLDKVAAAQLGRTLEAGRVEAGESWEIDPRRSRLTFALRHALVAEIQGRFTRWGGTLTTNSAQPTASHVEVWVDLASLDTGDAARDAQARSAQFFDVDHHPEARFISGRIRLPDTGNPMVEGRLELHGVAQDATFEIADRRTSTDPDGAERAIYLVRGEVDRRDFDLRWHTELDVRAMAVGARVSVEAHVEAVRRT